jgi:tetratricopeptide (TPR) repeat protein
LADLYREGQQFQEAIPLYLAALEAAPGDPTLWAGLGVSYQGSGIHQEALAAFHRAGALRPESSLYDYLSGLVYLSLRQRDKASAAFEAAARKMPARPGPHLELGRLYREDGQRGKSLEAFRRVLQLDPQNTAALRAVEDLSASPGDRGR